ncbi:hypothetical protein CcaverHIS002_0303250 [Cutaneotrichosporon cavernicola]|uniref:Uncharacterized protein n=1 Tax=Cutaneotrichosporon cavernicola TaxID=279322 RepID=A0AA48IAU4_9TREE|nr:uncharacterized protein CcaverHIS019_0303250 [Cutaneotrichosporon cavernicola]BEI82457.1 hypothetical protein CcaverHIS002_0303250 [Cutaneotrichosporon cavernicola]BEI90255.1 hypothetical protein CcaverHIS019_0303250 [Cutaneotrichosporon cavernicola]BEI98032.1 hypothetical protein CcaverHIS631_0303310 [Cutaneotrichosporon cavernicola]BEJ05809.1 hypothetical protein CcaverHIS641_0303310 [Cutaneotrichosporon cavernicola]
MVARYTATSVASLIRGVAATVRLAGAAKPGTLHRFRAALRLALHSAQPVLQVPHLPGSGRTAVRVTQLSHNVPRHPLGPVGGAFRTGTYRPGSRAPRGAALPANVGLGSARTFATASPAGSIPGATGNVPVVLRAFSQIFDDEDKYKPLTRGRRYIPYTPRKERRTTPRARQLRKRRAPSCSSSASIGEQLAAYFPFRPVEVDVVLPPHPEDLVTPGMSATLALPVAPSLDALLAPEPIPYADAEVGIGVLSRLCDGAEPLHDAYSAAGARLIPLLARMEALGLLNPGAWPKVSLQILCDSGRPDILRVVFVDRCAGDVLALLGDMLEAGRFALTDTYVESLSPADEAAIAEHWDSVHPAPTVQPSSPSMDLVMPMVDLSTPTIPYGSYAEETEPIWPESSPSMSPSSTPSMLDSWATSPALSRNLSFIDNLDLASFVSSTESDGWSVSPSEEDMALEGVAGPGIEVQVSWVGPGLSLIDSW